MMPLGQCWLIRRKSLMMKEKARVEEKVKERVVIEQDLAVHPELQLKRRRYHVDSILVPEQHAPKEG